MCEREIVVNRFEKQTDRETEPFKRKSEKGVF